MASSKIFEYRQKFVLIWGSTVGLLTPFFVNYFDDSGGSYFLFDVDVYLYDYDTSRCSTRCLRFVFATNVDF